MIPPLESLLSICGARAEHPSCGDVDVGKATRCYIGASLGYVRSKGELYLTPSPHEAMFDTLIGIEMRQCHPHQ